MQSPTTASPLVENRRDEKHSHSSIFGIDTDIVWAAVEKDFADLKPAIEEMLE
jgi:uncharacterized protein with HEPN domain